VTGSRPTSSSHAWPATALDAAQRAFDLLTCPPAALEFDCRGIPGLPRRLLPLDELRRALIRDTTPRASRDQVWRELVSRARRDGPDWKVAAVGIAMPGLRRRAGLLASGWRGETADLDAELLAGFLERLASIDVEAPNICQRLIDAGARAVRRSRRHLQDLDTVRVAHSWSLPPTRPGDHPDYVLARAVTAAVIGPEEALLISATRLDDVHLQAVADHLCVSVTAASSWRRRAERRVAAAIHAGDLDALRTAAAIQDPTRRAEALRRAVDLHIDVLADGHDYDWIEPHREHLRRNIIRARIHLAEVIADADPEQAVALTGAAADLDPASEDLARRHIQALQQVGDAAGLQRRVQTLIEALDDIEVDPDPEILGLGAGPRVAEYRHPGHEPGVARVTRRSLPVETRPSA
jgi:hypothetical protein